MTLKRLLSPALALLFTSVALFAAAPRPLRVLLVAGGCCHDYANQKEILKEGLEARAHVGVDFEFNPDKSTGTLFERYKKSDWAKGYDLVIHDECSASVKDIPYVENILRAHRDDGVPAVNLHCAMHCYRTGKDDWFNFVGIQSSAHGPQEPIAVTFTDKAHPITQGLGDWTTIKEELYNNVKAIEGSQPLARGKQLAKQKDGSMKEVEYAVAWANQFGKARVFSTTLGHNNETVADPRYLNLVTRGLLWACGKLNDEYLKPAGAELVPKALAAAKVATAAPTQAPTKTVSYGDRPNLAVAGTASASSEEKGKNNFAWKAIDGSGNSRWCASGGAPNNWWQVDLGAEKKITGVVLDWESRGGVYRYRVEGSTDGKQWKPLADGEKNEAPSPNQHDFAATARYVRVTHLASKRGGWASLWEVAVLGEKGTTQPAVLAKSTGSEPIEKSDSKGGKKAGKAAQQKAGDADKNLPIPEEVAKMPGVMPEKAAELIKEVKVPAEFDATIFATPPAVNYPVFVASAPDGTLYVSSDGNGSLGREPNRGRILRVRDTNGDGKADEVKVFVKNVDSPRGLVWDHDRVICLHPPHVSAFSGIL